MPKYHLTMVVEQSVVLETQTLKSSEYFHSFCSSLGGRLHSAQPINKQIHFDILKTDENVKFYKKQ